MPNDHVEHRLAEIGHILVRDTEYPLDGTLLFAELGDGYVAPSIFKDRGNHILYRDPDLRSLGHVLIELWEAQPVEHRWEEKEYTVHDGRFDVTFTYPEDIDRGDDPLAYRDTVVRRHFGDKPILYPPMGPDEGYDL